jgi:hypothetical protein
VLVRRNVPAGRRAKVVLVNQDGPLGCLPAVDLADPWWMASDDVLAALKEQFGLDGFVLRLLSASTAPFERGAEVVYAFENIGDLPPDLPLAPCRDIALGEDANPRRMPWARLGGVAADVAWADHQLAALSRPRTGPALQMRTWNLSLLLRLPTSLGPVWLKHVPPFFRHEGSVIAMVQDARCVAIPPLLAEDPVQGRLLLAEVGGVDQHDPAEPLAIRMVEALVTLQQRMISRREAVLASGAADWRATALLRSATELAARGDVRAELDSVERTALDAVIAGLRARLEALYSCGLEDTLIHGDFHPGNHRFDGHRLVLLDWGDSGVGHPLLDMAAFLERVPAEGLSRVQSVWLAAWKAVFPRAEVARAVDLIQPVAALRQAIIYRRFLDAIESSEQIYHRDDPSRWLRRAIALTGA